MPCRRDDYFVIDGRHPVVERYASGAFVPNDIDLNLHMNNARYLSVMDYARTHMLARTGLLTHIVRSRWQPLVGAVWMTYRRSLPLFSAFRISSPYFSATRL